MNFKQNCRKCERLSEFLCQVKAKHPDYFAKPVPAFGDPEAKLLIVGLAPGMHGANATGRPFTGDYAGILLYQTLHKFGFANQAESVSRQDGLSLRNCRITNAVKCLPPENKPTGVEINTCNVYLSTEISALQPGSIILALGSIAHQAVIKAKKLRQKDFAFGHGNMHSLDEHLTLVDSYHCSRYNTQTKRLTTKMFEQVFKIIEKQLAQKEKATLG